MLTFLFTTHSHNPDRLIITRPTLTRSSHYAPVFHIPISHQICCRVVANMSFSCHPTTISCTLMPPEKPLFSPPQIPFPPQNTRFPAGFYLISSGITHFPPDTPDPGCHPAENKTRQHDNFSSYKRTEPPLKLSSSARLPERAHSHLFWVF